MKIKGSELMKVTNTIGNLSDGNGLSNNIDWCIPDHNIQCVIRNLV